MQLKGLLDTANISIGDTASSKKRVLERAAQRLSADLGEITVEQVFERLLERERLGSTGLSGGVALPHARIPGLEAPRGAFLRLATAVEFDALDGQAVDLVFALVVPEDANDQHLQLLAQLAAMFSEETIRERLREADADQALEILTGQSSTNAA